MDGEFPKRFEHELISQHVQEKGGCVTEPDPSRGSVESEVPLTAPPKQRLLALDVLRGLTVALMILVNDAGDEHVSYAQLRHSVWNGCTLTDIVFPMFLFIVGASIALSFHGRLLAGRSRGSIFLQVLRRSLLIFLIGLLLNALPYVHFSELRYCGVLQRIALCYALASIIYLWGGVAGSAIAATSILLAYWGLLTRVRVPGYGLPGVDVGLLDPMGNIAAWLDREVIPVAHLYRNSFYDPEGLLSTLPAVATTLFGVLASSWLQAKRTAVQRTIALALVGAVMLLGGLFWAHSFPLNKRLWTSSYVLFTAGISMLILAALFWWIDGPPRSRRGLTPWLVFGTNALTAYILSEALAIVLGAVKLPGGGNLQQYLYAILPHWLGPPPLVSMLYSVLYVVVCAVPVFYLYRRKIFLKI